MERVKREGDRVNREEERVNREMERVNREGERVNREGERVNSEQRCPFWGGRSAENVINDSFSRSPSPSLTLPHLLATKTK
jgi:hypothetical protein